MLASCSLENFDCVPRDALEPSQFKGLVHLMRSASSGSRKRSSVFHQLQWWKSSLISRRLAITQPSPSQHAGQRLCVQDRYNSLLVFKFLRSTLYPRVGPLLENREGYRISWTFHGFSTDEVEDHLEIARQTWYDLHNASSISAYSKNPQRASPADVSYTVRMFAVAPAPSALGITKSCPTVSAATSRSSLWPMGTHTS